ncbi:MAG: PilZ domain-containing protein [Deltaproteobacteria bacterium]|nr:PilZ domain-containing protein [Deltaproteobacteria bacterium]
MRKAGCKDGASAKTALDDQIVFRYHRRAMPEVDERRRAPRFPVELHVEFRHLGRPAETYAEITRNLSSGGVFLESTVTLPVGTVVELEIAPGSNIRSIKLRAEVVRVEEEPATTGSRVTARIRGMALRFLEPDPVEHGRLMALAKHMSAKETHGKGG